MIGDEEEQAIRIEAESSKNKKCDRCWHFVDKLVPHMDSNICLRCLENIEGEGEKRKFF